MSNRLDRRIGRKSTSSGLLLKLNESVKVREVRLRKPCSTRDPTIANQGRVGSTSPGYSRADIRNFDTRGSNLGEPLLYFCRVGRRNLVQSRVIGRV